MADGTSQNIFIVGGGVVGASIAFKIAQSPEWNVTLFEAATKLGEGATAAAIGGITPQSESYCRGPLRHLALWSTKIYPEFLETLELSSAMQIPVLDSGQLQVALTDDEMERILRSLLPSWEEEGFETIVLSATETLRVEPSLNRELCGSVLLPIEFALEPVILMNALTVALANFTNVVVRKGVNISRITSSKSGACIETTSGERLNSDYVVIAAGIGSPALLPSLKDRIYPMRGQALEFRTGYSGYPLNHHVYTSGEPTRSSYLVPRINGRVVGGVTYEPNDERVIVDDLTLDRIVAGLAQLCPSSANWQRMRSWSGIRPASIDGIPFIGPMDEWSRIISCSGHQGLGVTLAPACSIMVHNLVSLDSSSWSPEVALALAICAPGRV